MYALQLSVFLENKLGRLAEVTSILAGAGVNIRALSLADTSDFGVLRLIVDKVDVAEEFLKKHGLTVSKTEVVAAEVEDKPGGLNNILEILAREGLNVEYMYAFVRQGGNHAIMIFRIMPAEKATKVLRENGINVVSGSAIYSL